MRCHVKLILPSTQGQCGCFTSLMRQRMTNSFPERREKPHAMFHLTYRDVLSFFSSPPRMPQTSCRSLPLSGLEKNKNKNVSISHEEMTLCSCLCHLSLTHRIPRQSHKVCFNHLLSFRLFESTKYFVCIEMSGSEFWHRVSDILSIILYWNVSPVSVSISVGKKNTQRSTSACVPPHSSLRAFCTHRQKKKLNVGAFFKSKNMHDGKTALPKLTKNGSEN